ncbi:alcohol dehydrogenase catalytic domain-containing protein [uncultured Enterovirga sp.]|uniref:alcohol dehydrogenase catalytic domain-containing protein n=1 Tax=uncultured Enterovirga sp. TaxID=2026352 RepID=UPI0035C9D5E3
MNSWQITRFGAPLELRCTAEPEPTGTEVLVRIRRSGVCHSDLHIWSGFFDLGGGKRFEVSQRMSLPFTLGHEIVGEVVGLGPEAEGVALGQHGIVHPWIGCSACHACQRRGAALRHPAHDRDAAGRRLFGPRDRATWALHRAVWRSRPSARRDPGLFRPYRLQRDPQAAAARGG